MTNCLFGSKAKLGSPASFTVDTGGLCFALGVSNAICPLLDKIPELVGTPWKKVIGVVAREAFGLVVDLITDRINTAQFCSISPPPLPPDITFVEVFSFIASYVPPFSLIASSDSLMRKITAYYLYIKWFELCECKKEEDEPPPPDDSYPPPDPIPKIVDDGSGCPSSQAILGANGNIFQQDARNQMLFNEKSELKISSDGLYANMIAINIPKLILDNNYLEAYDIFEDRPEAPSPVPPVLFEVQAGCIRLSYLVGVTTRYDDLIVTGTLYDQQGNPARDILFISESIVFSYSRIIGVDFDDCNCTFEPPPILPPPPSNCIPVPPPRYCQLFPDDPLCSNITPCDVEIPQAARFDVDVIESCEVIRKEVRWYLE